ncbi:hypothetical protein NHX12_009247 [Muraenolepis orangiensis]|uniref:Uncharacterized protein n=1 Tax=Muraenolepis orangiensis TaxID=630683 RepID=A0A9Q0DPG2_9TELE|nr:hypothetical protein NHX12_009247 [Muraenolepis orangiensis]
MADPRGDEGSSGGELKEGQEVYAGGAGSPVSGWCHHQLEPPLTWSPPSPSPPSLPPATVGQTSPRPPSRQPPSLASC